MIRYIHKIELLLVKSIYLFEIPLPNFDEWRKTKKIEIFNFEYLQSKVKSFIFVYNYIVCMEIL